MPIYLMGIFYWHVNSPFLKRISRTAARRNRRPSVHQHQHLQMDHIYMLTVCLHYLELLFVSYGFEHVRDLWFDK